MSEFTEKLVKYGGMAALGAAAGALTFWALTGGGGGDEEERPPIIVQGGSVDLTIEYPDETYQSKGSWDPTGESGKYRHAHDLSGPDRSRNSVFNGTCTGGAWRTGALTITYTDGSTDWTLDLAVKGKYIEVDTKGHDVQTYTDKSHITVKPKDVAAATWIKSVGPMNGSGASQCTFDQASKPLIRIEQKRN